MIGVIISNRNTERWTLRRVGTENMETNNGIVFLSVTKIMEWNYSVCHEFNSWCETELHDDKIVSVKIFVCWRSTGHWTHTQSWRKRYRSKLQKSEVEIIIKERSLIHEWSFKTLRKKRDEVIHQLQWIFVVGESLDPLITGTGLFACFPACLLLLWYAMSSYQYRDN